jgi:hypothetical protein
MLPSIPTEASYTVWLANCMQDYFESLCFTFYHEIQSQRREKNYPFDIYSQVSKGNIVKRIGLQVKRPYIHKLGIYWNLNSGQHTQMQKFNWIYYALPDFLLRRYYKVACHHTLFKRPNFPFVPHLYKSKFVYSRLGPFANGIETCKNGQILDESHDWVKSEDIFMEFPFNNQIHLYLDLTERKFQMLTNIQEKNDELS